MRALLSSIVFSMLALPLAACTEELPTVDAMQGTVRAGAEFCNWTPNEPGSALSFDLAVGLEIKEGVGIDLRPSAYWVPDPSDFASRRILVGIPAATSSAPEIVEVFSAPESGVALLARKPGTTTIRLSIAGHPGTVEAKITVTPSDSFVDRKELALPGPSETNDPEADGGGTTPRVDAGNDPEADAGADVDASTDGGAP